MTTDEPRWRRWGLVALRLIVAGVFIYASTDKIAHPDRFADIVGDYRILPPGLVNLFAICLPWVELLTGVCLVAGLWVPAAATLACAMTAAFIVGIAVNLVRGTEDFHCGCFGTGQEGESNPWGLLWRDGLLLAGCVLLLVGTWEALHRGDEANGGVTDGGDRE